VPWGGRRTSGGDGGLHHLRKPPEYKCEAKLPLPVFIVLLGDEPPKLNRDDSENDGDAGIDPRIA
jgi:hypothetical protein